VTASLVAIRPMTVADIDAIFPHEFDMFGSEAWTYEGYLDEVLNTETRYYVVAVDAEGAVLGDAGLMTIGQTAQIVTIGVLPWLRRRGIGALLVRHLVTHARTHDCEEVLLEVREDNDAARRLYEAEGFAILGRRRGYYDRGRVDAITMRLGLA